MIERFKLSLDLGREQLHNLSALLNIEIGKIPVISFYSKAVCRSEHCGSVCGGDRRYMDRDDARLVQTPCQTLEHDVAVQYSYISPISYLFIAHSRSLNPACWDSLSLCAEKYAAVAVRNGNLFLNIGNLSISS